MPLLPKVKRGECLSRYKNNIMCLKWLDKRDVLVLTTVHKNTMVDTGKTNHATGNHIRKPEAVIDYTNKVRLIDKADMMVATVNTLRKTMKWYKKLFFNILDMALLNAYYLYLVKTGEKPPFLCFSKSVIRQLISKFSKPTNTSRPGRKSSNISNPRRLIDRHFPSPAPSTTNEKARSCYMCAHTEKREKKSRTTRWMCCECNVALRLPECFRAYHTQAKF